MTITMPDSLERVLVGKTKILTPGFEAQLVADYQSGQFDANWATHHYYVAYKQRVEQLLGIAAVATTSKSQETLISPNPATTTIKFSFPNSDASKYHIAIHDMLGNTVMNPRSHQSK
jgi:hypothetical protein